MDAAVRGALIGCFAGAVGGFLIGGMPALVHHFLPGLPMHGKDIYPWPVNLMMAGTSGAIGYAALGTFAGFGIGTALQWRQSRRKGERPQSTETDNESPL